MGKPNSATERRRKLIEYLAGVLTSSDCPIASEDWHHFNFVGRMYGARDAVKKLAAVYDSWPEVQEEVLLAAAVEALNRLISQPCDGRD